MSFETTIRPVPDNPLNFQATTVASGCRPRHRQEEPGFAVNYKATDPSWSADLKPHAFMTWCRCWGVRREESYLIVISSSANHTVWSGGARRFLLLQNTRRRSAGSMPRPQAYWWFIGTEGYASHAFPLLLCYHFMYWFTCTISSFPSPNVRCWVSMLCKSTITGRALLEVDAL